MKDLAEIEKNVMENIKTADKFLIYLVINIISSDLSSRVVFGKILLTSRSRRLTETFVLSLKKQQSIRECK